MKVSVMTVTYNQEEYIGQAIEGVLLQETDFPYELVIGEDCSTDSTRDIVVGYQRRHPDRIRLLLSVLLFLLVTVFGFVCLLLSGRVMP